MSSNQATIEFSNIDGQKSITITNLNDDNMDEVFDIFKSPASNISNNELAYIQRILVESLTCDEPKPFIVINLLKQTKPTIH